MAGYRPTTEHPLLKKGSRGDMVVWAQMHLSSAGQEVPATGIFGKQTRAAVRAFQEEKGMAVDGRIGTETWRALLAYEPTPVRWAARASGASGRAKPATRPLSASLPAKAYEIPPGPRR